MDFVYICREGDNEELRYSIRSVCKNTKFSNIWVVGGKPDWYIGNHLQVSQTSNKHKNARNNLKKITGFKEISNDFILMNDDFFIMKPVEEIEYYHGGPLIHKVNTFERNEPRSPYTKLLGDTYDKLVTMGIDNPLDYALHVPMKMNRNNLSKVIKPGFSIRTLYGNIYNVGGTEIKDVKYHDKRIWANQIAKITEDNVFLSSSDSSFNKMKNKLQKEFPDASTYELS